MSRNRNDQALDSYGCRTVVRVAVPVVGFDGSHYCGVDLIFDALPFGRLWDGEPIPRHTLVTQLFGRCFLRSCEKERKTDGLKSIPKSPENVAPFTIGGWPVDVLSQGTMRLLRKIADEDGWTIEEVMTAAMEEFVATRSAEEQFKTKIIQFPTANTPRRSPAA